MGSVEHFLKRCIIHLSLPRYALPDVTKQDETGSSAEVNDVAMASVDGSIRRDDDYIEGVLFSDGSTRAELDECAVSLGLDPGDYEDKFHFRRALSAKLTQQSIEDRLAAATQHSLRERFVSPSIRDLESRRDVLTGQSAGWAGGP